MTTVKLYLLFREITGKDSLEYPDGLTPADILEDLAKKYPRIGKVLERGDFIVLVNGSPVPDKDIHKIMLRSDDVLELLPPASGGSATHY